MKQNPLLYALFALLFGMAAVSLAMLPAHAETPPVDAPLEMIPQQAYPSDVYGSPDYSAQLAEIQGALERIEANTAPTPSPEPTPTPVPTEEPPSVFEKPFIEYSLSEILLLILCVFGAVAVVILLLRRL